MSHPVKMNQPLSRYATRILASYLGFPEDQPFTALDFRCHEGQFLQDLTSKYSEHRALYGVEQYPGKADMAREKGFYKVCRSHYKSEHKITPESFSMVIVDPEVQQRFIYDIFSDYDPYTKPDFQKMAQEKVRRLQQEKQELEIDFGDEGLTEEEIAKRNEAMQKKMEKAQHDEEMAFRIALRKAEKAIAQHRDDSFLLALATDKLMPGGILVMVTPKEFIDQNITIRLVNQYENIQILRLDDDEYEEYRKCIILAKKRTKAIRDDRSQGILLAETKLTPYKEIPILDLQAKPMYQVPAQKTEAVKSFRVGPITSEEALHALRKSPLIENFQRDFSQVTNEGDAIAPTPLHKGHIMLLLTSGHLNGFIGKGKNQHLVKGSAIKMIKEFNEEQEDGTVTTKEREYYHIGVKYLDANGEFHRLM